MSRKSWLIIIAGLTVGSMLVCAGLFGLTMWFLDNIGADSSTLAFGDAIAIVRVEGVIVSGEAPPPNPFGGVNGMAYSQTIIKYLQDADENEDVKAIILYVDSPGGSVYASDEIYRQLMIMNKPVIAAMGSLAASGGYYVSAPTQEIWVSPHTLTCSIGVISQFLNLEEFGEEFGVKTITVKSGKFKDTGNPFRSFNEEDRALWQDIIDEAYDGFVNIVAEGRGMEEATVRQLADGRVCTGKQAQKMGFVDELGYLPEVIDRAAEVGGIEGEPRIIEYNEETSIWEAFAASAAQPNDPLESLKQMIHYHPGSSLMYLYVGP
ncbi:signal peptide peptidase SppA [Anaerolineales bacterium HSG24]|nr:signal peptide peptidase SppA [Anaerolineales bacterium HSG24]